MRGLSYLVNFSDVDSRSGDTPMFSFTLFLVKEKNFLGLLFRSGNTDNCTYVLNAFLQALRDFLAASWYFNQSESSFLLNFVVCCLFSTYLPFTLTSYPWLARSRGGHPTWGMPFLYVNYVFAKFCPQVVNMCFYGICGGKLGHYIFNI